MDKRETKAEIVKEYLEGMTTTRKLALKYGYSYGFVAKMIRRDKKEKNKLQLLQTSKLAIKEKEDVPTDIKLLQEELRMSRLQICLLEAMIDISDEQFGTDIRKKAGTRQS
jgi:transposase-like protein